MRWAIYGPLALLPGAYTINPVGPYTPTYVASEPEYHIRQ